MASIPGLNEVALWFTQLRAKPTNDPVSNAPSQPITSTADATGFKIGLDTEIINPSTRPVPVSFTPAALTPSIFNVTTGAANAESSQALPVGTQQFSIANIGNGVLQVSFTVGTSGTVFKTIPPGAEWEKSGINSTLTLYFQSNKASQDIEIVAWA